MKILSIIMIIAYLMLPAVCFGHPCEPFSPHVPQEAIVSDSSDTSDECPLTHGSDYCETTCCCAGHVPASAFLEIHCAIMTAKQLSYESLLVLPRLVDRIFVPPQNHS